MKARSKRAKGTKLEKFVANQLSDVGIRAHRQPGSGIFADWPHDAQFYLGDQPFIVECKAWKDGWRTGDKAMGAADIMVIKRDYGEPRVYMPWNVFRQLVNMADKATKEANEDAVETNTE